MRTAAQGADRRAAQARGREGRAAQAAPRRASRPAIRRARSARRSTARATAPSRCGACSAERDLAEAKGEAERAETSLERAGEHLSTRWPRRAAATAPAPRPSATSARTRSARRAALAQEIADDLAKIMPPPVGDAVAAGARGGARRRPSSRAAIGKRTDDVAGEAARRLGKMPGMEKAEGELRGAARAHAGRRPRASSATNRRPPPPPSATPPSGSAKLRDSMQERSMGGGRAAPRSGPHPGRRRIERAARLAPGAARRDEGEGARAVPRRGPPLLRGAGEVKRGLAALAARGGARARVGDRAPTRAAARPARPRPAPRRLAVRAHEIDALLDAWRFGEADAALATLKSAAPERARDRLPRRLPEVPARRLRRRGARARPRAAAGAAGPTRGRAVARRARRARRATRSRTTARSARAHVIIRYAPEDAVLVPYARDTLEAAYAGAARRSRLRGRAADPGRALPQPRPIWRRCRRCRGGGGAHRDDRALQVGAPDGHHAARARLRLPLARQHQPRAGPLRRLDADRATARRSGCRRGWPSSSSGAGASRPAGASRRRWSTCSPRRCARATSSASRRCTRRWPSCRRPRTPRSPSPRSRTRSPTSTKRGACRRCATRSSASAAGDDARAAVAAAAGGAWPEFERGWRAFMVAQHYKTFPAIDIPTTHIRKPGAHRLGPQARRGGRAVADAEGGRPLSPPAPRQHAAARAIARAPRSPNTRRGAKAVGPADRPHADPSATWVFPVKLGRTYLALGEPDRALKALAPVQALYPDLPWPNLIAGEALAGARATPPRRSRRCARRWRPTRSTRASTARSPTPTASCPPARPAAADDDRRASSSSAKSSAPSSRRGCANLTTSTRGRYWRSWRRRDVGRP